MAFNDPDERARRAVIRAIDPLTELVTIFDSDPGNSDPDPSKLFVEPDNLFDMTFSRIGIDSDLLIGGFRTGLKRQLPGFESKIDEVFGDLKPGVQIKIVYDRLSSELGLAMG